MSSTGFMYVQLLLEKFIYAVLILSAYNFQQSSVHPKSFSVYFRSLGIGFTICILLFVVSIFFSGDRGPAIYMVIAYLCSAQMATGKFISFKVCLVLLVTGGLIMSVMGIVRQNKDNEDLQGQSMVAYQELQDEESIIPYTSELAESVRTLHAAVEYVPEQIDHTKGVYSAAYILQSIPFSSSFTQWLFPHSQYLGSTTLLTFLIQGDNKSSGVGTTCIADIYIDFGMLGVFVLMFLFGCLLSYCDVLWLSLKTLPWFVCACLFIVTVFAVYLPRSAMLFQMKNIVWLFVILSLYTLFSKRSLQ